MEGSNGLGRCWKPPLGSCAAPWTVKVNEFGENGWQIQHVKAGDSLDLPVDEVELSISSFVASASF